MNRVGNSTWLGERVAYEAASHNAFTTPDIDLHWAIAPVQRYRKA